MRTGLCQALRHRLSTSFAFSLSSSPTPTMVLFSHGDALMGWSVSKDPLQLPGIVSCLLPQIPRGAYPKHDLIPLGCSDVQYDLCKDVHWSLISVGHYALLNVHDNILCFGFFLWGGDKFTSIICSFARIFGLKNVQQNTHCRKKVTVQKTALYTISQKTTSFVQSSGALISQEHCTTHGPIK